MINVSGIVVEGHRIASGLNPTGKNGLNATVVKQMPFFIKSGIPRMNEMFLGTVNVNLEGKTFEIKKPEHKVICEWQKGVTETFYFISAVLLHKGKNYEGYVYFPLPESGFQERNREVIEFLMPQIFNLFYGDEVSFTLDESKLAVFDL